MSSKLSSNLGSFSTRDDSIEESKKRLNENFKPHEFKYIDGTLTLKEREILLKYGTKFQMFVDGKYREYTEECKQIISGCNNAVGSLSESVQVWFKYQNLLEEEEKARKLKNKRCASTIIIPTPYRGE
jgi:uncharacterized protein YifE (UPF0438 family)